MARNTSASPNLTDLAKAIARWDNEGGALAFSELGNTEERVLRCLGAAVILEWSDLPTEIQRSLFEGATAMSDSEHQFQLKQLVARFLHVHKDDG